METDDPPLVGWDLFEYLSSGVGMSSVQANDKTRTEFVQPGESYIIRGFSSVDNDEVIARAYQEELATKEAMEVSEKSHHWSDWPFSDPWSAEAVPHHNYDPNSDFDYDSQHSSEDEGAPELSEEFGVYDGEIGKRLNHMDSIPHVPRINGEIPTVDDVSTARQRLLDRLKLNDLHELKMDGDGNCQFRAFSDQLYRTPAHHKSVRDDVVTQLTSHPEYYKEYVPMNYSDYVTKMAKSGEWGDHVTLQAAADFYGVKISLLTSFKDTSFIQILPRETKSNRVIFLSFWAEVHYNSVYANGDAPLYSESRKKSRRLRHYLKNKLKL